MLILNQDRNATTENMEIIINPISDSTNHKTLYRIENEKCLLGVYLTEERAKEIIQEITNVYNNQSNKYHFTNVNIIYKMPEN